MRTSVDLELSDMEELFKEEVNVVSFMRKLVEMAEKGLDSARNEYDISKTKTWASKLVEENKKLKKELAELKGKS